MRLAREQTEVLIARLRPMLGYPTRVRRRMEQLRLGDKLYHDLLRAQMAMQDLCGELHYRSRESGVARARSISGRISQA